MNNLYNFAKKKEKKKKDKEKGKKRTKHHQMKC